MHTSRGHLRGTCRNLFGVCRLPSRAFCCCHRGASGETRRGVPGGEPTLRTRTWSHLTGDTFLFITMPIMPLLLSTIAIVFEHAQLCRMTARASSEKQAFEAFNCTATGEPFRVWKRALFNHCAGKIDKSGSSVADHLLDIDMGGGGVGAPPMPPGAGVAAVDMQRLRPARAKLAYSDRIRDSGSFQLSGAGGGSHGPAEIGWPRPSNGTHVTG